MTPTRPSLSRVIRVRSYGSNGPTVVVLHGGPGAPGYMAPVARALADTFRVLEPLQRRSGSGLLTVARHVEDLHEVIATMCAGVRPALVGSSWGAMLALAYAAAHSDEATPIVAIGSGTFDLAARARMRLLIDERRSEGRSAYDYDRIEAPDETLEVDERGRREAWDDMLRLQAEGVYPAAFSAIRSPVLMLHGEYDPHPGAMIRDSLAPWISKLEYREWPRCGHYPWMERHARDEFLATLRAWLREVQ
jgi:pimeloyl-ACP methyl ester carboxylesterase